MRYRHATRTRQEREDWTQQGFATTPIRWGKLGRLLSPPQAQFCGKKLPTGVEARTAYGEEGREIINTTPLPQKLRRRQIPFWLFLAAVAAMSFGGFFMFWLWWGNLPR